MISDFKIFPILLLRQLNFDIVGLSPESCLAICHPQASCLQIGCLIKKVYVRYRDYPVNFAKSLRTTIL